MGAKEKMVQLVSKVPLVLLVLKASQVQLVPRERWETTGSVVLQVQLASLVSLDQLEQREAMEFLEHLDLKVSKVKREHRVFLVFLAHQEKMEPM